MLAPEEGDDVGAGVLVQPYASTHEGAGVDSGRRREERVEVFIGPDAARRTQGIGVFLAFEGGLGAADNAVERWTYTFNLTWK